MRNADNIWIPNDIDCTRAKYMCDNFFSGGTPSTSDYRCYEGGDIPWIASGKCQDCDVVDETTFITKYGLINSSTRLIKPNSTLIAMTGATCGKVGILKIKACANQSVFAYELNSRNDSRFLFYSLIAGRDSILLNQLGGAQAGINGDVCKNIYIPKFDLSMQTRIANFLENKVAAIDELIKKEEELLNSISIYKKRFITKVVLNGLHNVKHKNIENKWIHSLPEKWEFKKIKYILDLEDGIKVGPFGSALSGKVQYEESDIKIYGQWNVIAGSFEIDRNFIEGKHFNSLKQYEVIPGDVLVSMMGTIGKCLTVPTCIKKGIMDSHIIKIRLNKKIFDSKYFEFVYDKDNSEFVFEQLNYLKKGSIMDGLNSTILKEIFVPIPPIDEQKEISNFLCDKCSKIDELINLKSSKIRKLKEYKKSLIYECVTGRRKV